MSKKVNNGNNAVSANFNSAIEGAKQVIFQKYFSVLFLLAALLSFGVLSFLTLATTTDYSIGNFVAMNGLIYTILAFSMTLATSALIGAYVILVTERFQTAMKAGKKIRASGIAGIIAGVLGSGCPMCGSFIFGMFGAPLALYGLPFHGLEIKAISVVLLGSSVFLMSKSPESCKINKL